MIGSAILLAVLGAVGAAPGNTRLNSIGMELVEIPAGSFTMGTSDQQIDWLARHTDWAEQWREKGRFDRERPQQSVALPDYAIARYPVTVGEFRTFGH